MNRFILYFLCLLPALAAAQNTRLSGFVSTETGSFVDQVRVRIFDEEGQFIAETQTVNGRYTFAGLPSGYTYRLQLSREGNPLNGLSTFDFVLIARHLLAVERFPSPNQLLAADVDGSNTVSITDLLYLRQLILGIIPDLPQQRNWLFLPHDPGPAEAQGTNIFSLLLNEPLVEQHFTILKIGDVNRTARFE